MKYLLVCIMLVGCASKKVVVKPKPKLKLWSEKKRDCHTLYLDRFGLTTDNAIKICKEELERGE